MRGFPKMSWLQNHAAKLRVAAVICVAAIGASACATQDYVDKQIAGVNGRIDQLDSRVGAAASSAQQANQAAAAAASSAQAANSAAQGAATDARTASQRIDQLEGRVTTLETPKPATTGRKPRG
jgi:chromosome segregation ATPase